MLVVVRFRIVCLLSVYVRIKIYKTIISHLVLAPTVAHACRKRRLNGYCPGWGLELRASNPVSVKNLTSIEEEEEEEEEEEYSKKIT
jgi:hypothetical protein